jgi:hypothetical protein
VVWEVDKEVMKRSGRDQPIWVVIHKCMKAMLRISLYLYLKLAKTLCLSYYCLCILFNKIGEEGRTGSAWKQGMGGERQEAGWRDGSNNVCTYE